MFKEGKSFDEVKNVVEGGLDTSIKNIDEFIGGNKSFDDVLDDCRPKKTKTLTVNLKPGKSKTVKIYFGKYPVSKPTRWTYKILQFWYKQ